MNKKPVQPRLPPSSQGERRERRSNVLTKPRPSMARQRANSTGSTRGAFGPMPPPENQKAQPPVAQVTVEQRKKNRKSKQTKNPKITNENAQDFDLADIAAQAVAADEEHGFAPTDNVNNSYGKQTNIFNHTPLPPHPSAYEENNSPMTSPEREPTKVIHDDERRDMSYYIASRNRSDFSSSDLAISQSTIDRDDTMSPNRVNPHYFSSEQSNLLGANYFDRKYNGGVAEMTYNNMPPYNQHTGPSYVKQHDQSDGYSSKSVVSDSDFRDNPEYSENKKESYFSYRNIVYDEDNPEFTSLQQTFWAVVIGAVMGVFTAVWGIIIEFCVDFVWETVPTFLYEHGIFTDLEGKFPLTHYMWVCPAIFGGILAYITAALAEAGGTIPGQNEWIESLHSTGVMDHSTILNCILISTAGMASGLSLGPEMPLVLVCGMMGSWLGDKYQQSVLSCRVMNLTAAGAGIGGFFGFPLAGALFVLELPHRMGLQYFEAFSPATIASIAAVLVNRMVTRNEVNGYFDYPFLGKTLPSHVFYIAIVYGFVGSAVGVLYAEGCLFLKKWVHDWFHAPHDDHDGDHSDHDTTCPSGSEPASLGMEIHPKKLKKNPKKRATSSRNILQIFTIPKEPIRAAVAGVVAGIIVGLLCMFVPHTLFWGEAQLQTLIDRGRTPLPVFGEGDEPTAMLTAYGYCLVDPEDERATAVGFSTSCAGVITAFKIIAVGLSLGTGVMGGHFWAPLCVACSASHFVVDIFRDLSEATGFGGVLSTYPCVALMCIMGSAHVVTFRAHTAIMLILTLTIKSFTTILHSDSGGDYSAIFPLLVVACFVPLTFTRGCVFYKQQRCRGDITAIAEVLCLPNAVGKPEIYQNPSHASSSIGDDDLSLDDESTIQEQELPEEYPENVWNSNNNDTAEDGDHKSGRRSRTSSVSSYDLSEKRERVKVRDRSPIPTKDSSGRSQKSLRVESESAKINDSLDYSQHSQRRIQSETPPVSAKDNQRSRRIQSAPSASSSYRDNSPAHSQPDSRSRTDSRSRVKSIGKITDFAEPLLDQGRKGAATRHRRSRSSASNVSTNSYNMNSTRS